MKFGFQPNSTGKFFSKSGVNEKKIVVIPEGLDTGLYDPLQTQPYIFESKKLESKFKFLSVFKWEERKGWDVLLRAYFEEFGSEERVALVLHTYLYGTRDPRNKDNVMKRVLGFAETLNLNKSLPEVVVLTGDPPQKNFQYQK